MAPLSFAFFTIIFQRTFSQSYILQTKWANFEDSEAGCLFHYSQHLASFHSNQQLIEANDTILDNNVYIGIHDEVVEDDWVWTDGTPFDYGTTYYSSPWNSGEPNNVAGTLITGEDCVHLRDYNALWNDIHCTSVMYSLCNYPQSIYLVNDPVDHPGHSRNISSAILGYIDILDDIYIEFDFIIHSFPLITKEWAQILKFGYDDTERVPGIWLHQSQMFYFSFAQVVNNDPAIATTAFLTLEAHIVYHIIFHQKQNHLFIKINDTMIYNASTPSHAILIDRPMRLGTNETSSYALANGTISNLIISSSNSYSPLKFNYFCDGLNRFTAIGGSWSFDDSLCSATQSDGGYSGAVAWMGDKDISSLDWIDYKVEIELTVSSGIQAGILLRSQTVGTGNDAGQQYFIGIGVQDNEVIYGRMNNGWNSILNNKTKGITLAYNTRYILRAEISTPAATVTIYLNNVKQFTSNDIYSTPYQSGSVSLRTYQSSAVFHSLLITFPSDNYIYTINPTQNPTINPTTNPSLSPSIYPSVSPTKNPTLSPTKYPSIVPSVSPIKGPTTSPTKRPTLIPITTPTKSPILINIQSTDTQQGEDENSVSLLDPNNSVFWYILIGTALVILGICAICGFWLFWQRNRALKKAVVMFQNMPTKTALTHADGDGNGNTSAIQRIASMSSIPSDGNAVNHDEDGLDIENVEPDGNINTQNNEINDVFLTPMGGSIAIIPPMMMIPMQPIPIQSMQPVQVQPIQYDDNINDAPPAEFQLNPGDGNFDIGKENDDDLPNDPEAYGDQFVEHEDNDSDEDEFNAIYDKNNRTKGTPNQ